MSIPHRSDIEEEIARALAEYLATDFEHGPFSDTAFVRAEVEADGMVSLFENESESAWPVASFDAPQLAEWIVRSPLLNRVRAEALREAAVKAQEAFAEEQGGIGYARVRTDWLHAEANRIDPNSEGRGEA